MVKKYKNSDLYNCSYPNYLTWSKAIWITQVGDIVCNSEDNTKYKVHKVELTPIKGVPPRIYVEKLASSVRSLTPSFRQKQ